MIPEIFVSEKLSILRSHFRMEKTVDSGKLARGRGNKGFSFGNAVFEILLGHPHVTIK